MIVFESGIINDHQLILFEVYGLPVAARGFILKKVNFKNKNVFIYWLTYRVIYKELCIAEIKEEQFSIEKKNIKNKVCNLCLLTGDLG